MSSYYIHCAPQQIADIKKPTLGGLNSSGWVKHIMGHSKDGGIFSRGGLYRVPPVQINLF